MDYTDRKSLPTDRQASYILLKSLPAPLLDMPINLCYGKKETTLSYGMVANPISLGLFIYMEGIFGHGGLI